MRIGCTSLKTKTINPLIGVLLATSSSLGLFPTPASTTEQVISYYADVYQVSAEEMAGTLWCESKYKSNAVGDHGHSYGIAQIYLDYHKDVSKKQALNPIFSIEWMARQFSVGNKHLWSCARHLGYKDLPPDTSLALKKKVVE